MLQGRRFHLTPTARALMPMVRRWLRDAEVFIAASHTFDPSTSERVFRVAASDYTSVVVLTRLASDLASSAPRLVLDIVPPVAETARELDKGALDLLVGPEPFMSNDQPHDHLFDDRYVIAGWSQNPLLRRPLEFGDLADGEFVVASFGPDRTPSYADQQIAALGIRLRSVLTTSSFLSLPWFLTGTKRLAVLHERSARFFAAFADLSIAEPPFHVPVARFMLQYHRSGVDDPGLTWLRGRIRLAADSCDATPCQGAVSDQTAR